MSPSLVVVLVSPINDAPVSPPVVLSAQVTSLGSSVESATVRFYIGSILVGTGLSDSSGFASSGPVFPTAGPHLWYATAEKTGYTSSTPSLGTFISTPL